VQWAFQSHPDRDDTGGRTIGTWIRKPAFQARLLHWRTWSWASRTEPDLLVVEGVAMVGQMETDVVVAAMMAGRDLHSKFW